MTKDEKLPKRNKLMEQVRTNITPEIRQEIIKNDDKLSKINELSCMLAEYSLIQEAASIVIYEEGGAYTLKALGLFDEYYDKYFKELCGLVNTEV